MIQNPRKRHMVTTAFFSRFDLHHMAGILHPEELRLPRQLQKKQEESICDLLRVKTEVAVHTHVSARIETQWSEPPEAPTCIVVSEVKVTLPLNMAVKETEICSRLRHNRTRSPRVRVQSMRQPRKPANSGP